MPSLTMYATVSVTIYLFVLLGMWAAVSSKAFRNQPTEDQARARKQFKWAKILMPFSLAGVYLFLHAPPNVIALTPLALYFALWIAVAWFFWRSYRLGVARDIRLVKGMSGRPLQNPDRFLNAFAFASLFVAVGLLSILVAIPVLQLQLAIWPPLLAAVTGIYSVVIATCEKRSAG